MHATGCRCLDHWHTTDELTQRKIAALDLNLAQEHIERVEKLLPETFVSRIRTNSLASLQCGTTVNGQSSKPSRAMAQSSTKQRRLRLVKVLVQPVFVLDDGESIVELEHPATAIPASEWPTYSSERFPAEVQALGVGLPYAITTAILGGTTEWLALQFKAIGQEEWFYWYVAGAALISLVVYLAMPETRRTSLLNCWPGPAGS